MYRIDSIECIIAVKLGFSLFHSCLVSGVSNNSSRGSGTCELWGGGEDLDESGSSCHPRTRSTRWHVVCSQFFSKPTLHTKSFFSKADLTKMSQSKGIAESVPSSIVYAFWSYVETVPVGHVLAFLRAYWDQRRIAKVTSERWYQTSTPGAIHHLERWCQSPMSLWRCMLNTRQLLLLIFVLLGPLKIMLPRQTQGGELSGPQDTASQDWNCQSICVD